MKHPTFFQGVVVAGLLAFIASAAVVTLAPVMGISTMIGLVIPALSLAYILYLLDRSKERTGRVVTLSLWVAFAAITFWAALPMQLYLLVHVVAIWLIRSLYFYTSIASALLDLGVNALSISAATWAMSHSGSVFLSTWCFFLVQAVFVAIPTAIRKPPAIQQNSIIDNENFIHAKRNAEKALRQLFTQ